MDLLMDRTSSNPLFRREDSRGMERGPAPIPEEYQRAKASGPRPPPAPPSAPPPDVDEEAHAAFEAARMDAAKKREARPNSFRRFLPRLPSSPSKADHHGDAAVEPLESATANATENPARNTEASHSHRSFSRFLPRMPSKPSAEVSDAEHEEFDRLKREAEAKRAQRKMPRPPSKLPSEEVDPAAHAEYDRLRALAHEKANHRMRRHSTPLNRVFVAGQSFFMNEPPPLEATAGDDDGEKVANITPTQPAPVFKTRKERIMYEIRYRHAIERALMAGLAVCLLWLTSLAVAQSIVYSMIIGPKLDSVMTSVDRAMNTTTEEQDLYASCAQRRAEACNKSFNFDLEVEVGRCNGFLLLNRKKLDNFTNARLNCSDHFGEVILSMDYLVKVKAQQLIPPYTKVANLSSSPQCANVERILADQIAAINALKTAQTFEVTTDAQVTSVHQQYRDRAAYDLQYSANATVGLLLGGDALNLMVTDPKAFFNNMSVYREQMFACTTATGTYGNATCGSLSLMQRVENMRAQLINNYQNQRLVATSSANNLLGDYAPLQNFYQTFRALVNRYAPVKSAFDGIANDKGGGGGGIGAFGYQDIDTNINPPDLPSVNDFTNGIGTTAAANGVNQQNINRMLGMDANTKATMDLDTARLKQGQVGWQGSFFSDYNPPPFDVEGAAWDWKKTTTGYLPEVQSDLSLVAKPVSPQVQDEFHPDSDATESGRKAQALLQDYNVTGFSIYYYSNIDPKLMLAQWHEVQNLALVMDYLYRTFRSISIIRSYWRVSAVLAPPADVRVGVGIKKGVAQTVRRNPDQAIAYLITHPAVNLVLLLLFLGIACSVFLSIYLPFFDQYVTGCAKVQEYDPASPAQGTMITKNSYTVAMQEANSDGDIYTSTEIDRINVARELKCSQNEDLVFRQQRLYAQEFDFNIQKWQDLLTNVQAFRACINGSAVDANFPGLALNATNTSTSVNLSLYHPTCNMAVPILDTSEFNCSAISNCDPTCTGANEATVGRVTWDAGCLAEYYLHSGILGSGFAALAFILMNLSRWTFLRGLRRALMSHFAIGEYSYLATAREDGTLVYPDKVTEEGLSMREVIQEELHQTIKKFERSGIYICIVALLLNLPWVVGLMFFAENLQFQTNGNL